MNRYRDEARDARRPTAPAGIWGSPEFLFGITRGSYREARLHDNRRVRHKEQGIPDPAPAARDPWTLRLAQYLLRWLRSRGRAAGPAHSAETKAAPAE